MLISDIHKFIFVHVQKTAGVSLKTCLLQNTYGIKNLEREWIYGNRITSQGFLTGVPGLWSHPSALTLKKIMPKKWEEYRTFAIVRNPWDRMVSRYFFSRDQQPRESDRWRRQLVPECSTFEKFLIRMNNNEMISKNNYIQNDAIAPQYKKIYDQKGNQLVDDVLRFESLQDHFNNFCDSIKICRQQLPHKQQTDHLFYKKYYNTKTRKIVADKYKKDIEYFGYEF